MRAATHKPTLNDAIKAKITKSGKKMIFAEGRNWYQIIRPARSTAEITKSTKLVITLAAGMTSLGKYTLEIRFELVTRLLPLSVSAVAKNCHGSMPQKTRSGYRTPPAGILPNLPKTSVSITMVRTGRSMDHE